MQRIWVKEQNYEVSGLVLEDSSRFSLDWRFHGAIHDQNWLLCENFPLHTLSFSLIHITNFIELRHGFCLIVMEENPYTITYKLILVYVAFLSNSDIILSTDYVWVLAAFDDKVTVLESEKRAWENSPEAQAMRDSLNPWRDHDNREKRKSY
ncbi:T-box transcription factor TBX2 [Striga asiatica]|uniref:T-box transcription factor TBX2 n=1 Tax=Striga asiatica TaxID=4170 RepID=A0A5A7P342_STRAF|nr:T-box transcription factor TBX2 [Striga asiatica]